MIAVASPALDLEGTHNFRSTAGYPAATGRLREGGLFRSDALHRLSNAGREAFLAQGISRVIDLRDAEELEHSPSALSAAETETVHHPIFGPAGAAAADSAAGAGLPALSSYSLDSVYRYMVEHRAERVAEAVRLIADAPEGGVLVHCTAGKDRTGVVVAATLTAVGVSRAQVVADYAASGENLAGEWADRMLSGAAERFGPLDDDVRDLMIGSPAAAIDRVLDLIDESYGGVEAMLLQHGLDEATLDRLRSRLVAA